MSNSIYLTPPTGSVLTPTPAYDYVAERYRRFLSGKNVVLIGGADNYNPSHAYVRDKDAVFVRINSHVERQKGPCDVLYHTCIGDPNIEPQLLDTITPRFVWLNAVDTGYENGTRERPVYADFIDALRMRYPTVDVGFFCQGQWMHKNPYSQSCEWLNELHKSYNTILFTGLIALAHVLTTPVVSITVYGMDLYTERVRPRESLGIHHPQANASFLYDAQKDPRVTLDEPILKGLRSYGHLC